MLVHCTFLSGIVFGSLSGSFCVAITICAHVCSTGSAKSRTQPLGVSVICLARCVVIAPLGAVPAVGGGSSDPSVPRSPGVTLQEGRAAHGPLHPAVNIPLGIC